MPFRNYTISVLLIICVISLFSCSSEKDMDYNKNEIGFKVPSGWEISTEGEVKDRSKYVTCRKKSFFKKVNSVSIEYFKDSLDLVELLDYYIESDKNTFSMFNPTFDSIAKCVFNGYSGYKFNYRMKISNYETIYSHRCFHVNNRSVLIIISESAEDTTDNKADINKIFFNLSFK